MHLPCLRVAGSAERFIIPSRVASIGGAPSLGISANIGSSALIPPPRPFPSTNPPNAGGNVAQPIPAASGLAIHRLRRESLNSSSSSSLSGRDPQGPPYPNPSPSPFATNPGTSSLSSSPVSGALPIRRPNINPVHPFKSNTLSSASGSSPSLSIRQAPGSPVPSLSGGTAGVGGHSRQPSSASPINPSARLPPSPIGAAHPSPPGYATTFAPSSLGDRERRPGTSGSGASSERDRRASMNSIRMGSPVPGGVVGAGGLIGGGITGTGDSEDGLGRMPMPVPQRKRYSSSFGHRYTGSVGSAASGGVGSGSGGGAGIVDGRIGGGGTGGGSTPGSGGGSGRGTPASAGLGGGGLAGQEGLRKEGAATSFLNATTDDDDISIFVQDIDARKPLSGRAKEREKRDRDREHAHSHGHGRDATDTTEKGKKDRDADSEKDRDREGEKGGHSGSSSGTGASTRPSRGLGLGFPSRDREASYPYPYNTPSLGLGLGRGRHASASSSTLGTSEAGASQGSEEVIGRMELYEERRRSGYQG
ncbi:hypothetical protein BDZ97DRAFT_888430 [Flammula alnicola]|nr:hypothetical protein BDZ97DRAFT_888430 [Flammula alnicola]